jgi:hypothetical protein
MAQLLGSSTEQEGPWQKYKPPGPDTLSGADGPAAAGPWEKYQGAQEVEPAEAAATDEEPGLLSQLGTSAQRGFRSLQQLRNLYGIELGEDPQANIARIAELEEKKQSLPESRALAKFGRAKTFGDAWSAFLEAPISVAGNLAVESLAQFAPGLPLAAGLGMAGGSVAGPVGSAAGLAAGVGGTSFLIEYGSKIFEVMGEEGVDLTNPDQISAAFADPEFMDRASERAVAKGVPVAIFDAISGGIAGRLLLAAPKKVGWKLAAGAGELALQSGLGGAGEAAGQVSEKGQITEPAGILGEMIAELGPGLGEVIVGRGVVAGRESSGGGTPPPEEEPPPDLDKEPSPQEAAPEAPERAVDEETAPGAPTTAETEDATLQPSEAAPGAIDEFAVARVQEITGVSEDQARAAVGKVQDPAAVPSNFTEEVARRFFEQRGDMAPRGAEAEAAAEIAEEVAKVELEPSEAQKEAGNYKKGHIKFQDLDVTIETPKGAIRRGKTEKGEPWKVEMPAHYGYIKRTVGADQEQVDVYVGDDTASDRVFVIDQVEPETAGFDEHKAILGVRSVEEAEDLYRRGFSDGRGEDRMGAITEMSMPEFQGWLESGETTAPLAHGQAEPEPIPDFLQAGPAIPAEELKPSRKRPKPSRGE